MEHVRVIEQNYMNIEEAAKKWGVTPRCIQAMCAGGKLEGATQIGRAWFLPKNMKKPPDGRTKKGQKRQMPICLCRARHRFFI